MSDENGQERFRRRLIARRRFLAATAGATLAGVAGCSSLTDHEFDAPPVVLPEPARGELVVAETARESSTITREIDRIDGEVTITSQSATYARGPAQASLSTLLAKFLGRVNGGEGTGAAAVVSGSAGGLGGTMSGNDDYWLSELATHVSVVVPAGIRDGQGGTTDQPIPPSVLALGVVDADEGDDPSPVDAAGDSWLVDARDVFPDAGWLDEEAPFHPGRWWFPAAVDGQDARPAGDYPAPDNFSPETPVLVALGDQSPEEVFGVAAAEMPGEPVDDGASFGSTNPFLVTAPISGPFQTGNNPFLAESPDGTASAPAPLAGATYGLGVLSTPTASVASQSTNPLVNRSLADLLTHDAARDLVLNAGHTGADDLAWRAGPTEIGDVPDGTEFAAYPNGTTAVDAVAILDVTAEARTFGGVVEGDYPWLVLVNLARADLDDYAVIAAGVQRMPVGTADYNWENWLPADDGETTQPFNPFLSWLGNGALMSTSAFGALDAA